MSIYKTVGMIGSLLAALSTVVFSQSNVIELKHIRTRLQDKLNSIVIPQFEFRQANIVDVIRFLDQASIANDKDSAPDEKGVSFILQLKRPGTVAETEPTAAANLPVVTLSMRNVVLMDAVKYITEVAGLKYRIEENVVVITMIDVVDGELITRTYKVQPSVAEMILNAAGNGGGVPIVEQGDVKKFFVDAGVPFPEGTSIVYKPSLNLLIVKNTEDNLARFERIKLPGLTRDSPQNSK